VVYPNTAGTPATVELAFHSASCMLGTSTQTGLYQRAAVPPCRGGTERLNVSGHADVSCEDDALGLIEAMGDGSTLQEATRRLDAFGPDAVRSHRFGPLTILAFPSRRSQPSGVRQGQSGTAAHPTTRCTIHQSLHPTTSTSRQHLDLPFRRDSAMHPALRSSGNRTAGPSSLGSGTLNRCVGSVSWSCR